MFQVDTLIRTPLVTIMRASHIPEMIVYGTEEELEISYDVTFIEAGSFSVGARGKDWTLNEGSMLVQRAGDVHRYTHVEGVTPDVCLTVRFADRVNNFCERELATCGIAPRVTNRLAYLRWRLMKLLASGDGIAVDCWTADVFKALRDSVGDTDHRFRASQLRWYAERVDAVRSTLEESYSQPHSLSSMASSVGISPFLFARVFRELIGRAPHQYLLHVRLETARRMLLDGARVTNVCFDTGFSSLSHFIHTFKRRFGCPPSEIRRRRR